MKIWDIFDMHPAGFSLLTLALILSFAVCAAALYHAPDQAMTIWCAMIIGHVVTTFHFSWALSRARRRAEEHMQKIGLTFHDMMKAAEAEVDADLGPRVRH
jgi:hypothetical protein